MTPLCNLHELKFATFSLRFPDFLVLSCPKNSSFAAMNQGYGSKGVVVPPRMGQGKGQGAVVAAVPTPTAGVQSGKGKGGGGSWGSNWGGCGVPWFQTIALTCTDRWKPPVGIRVCWGFDIWGLKRWATASGNANRWKIPARWSRKDGRISEL